MPFELQVDFSGWDRIANQAPAKTLDILQNIGDAIVFEEIQGHWSGASPSSPGNPPAVVSGALDASITSYPIAGGSNPAVMVDASKQYYAGFLEDGTVKMDPRPFFKPAIERARKFFTSDAFKAVFS